MNGEFARHLRLAAILLLVAGAATACGRKGSLEPAPSADATKKQGDQASADEQPASPAQSGGLSGFRAKKPVPVLPKKTPSILDPILE